MSTYASVSTNITKDMQASVGARIDAPLQWFAKTSLGITLSKHSATEMSFEAGSTGVQVTPSVTRWGYSFRFPLLITPFFSLDAALGTFVYTAFLTYILKQLLINPWKANRKQQFVIIYPCHLTSLVHFL